MQKKERDYSSTIRYVGITTIIWNVILSIFKAIAGILGQSTAMVSDAVHSGSDVFTTIIVMIGAKISGKASDDMHMYGHERFESVASIFLSFLLAATAVGIGYQGVVSIVNFDKTTTGGNAFTYLALIGAISSIIIKGVMFVYTNNEAKRINSTSLKADAWHHLSDSLSSIGSLLGIVGLMIGNGWQILDPIAGIIICLVILKVSFDIVKSAVDQLVDKCISDELTEEMKGKILEESGVKSIKSFKSRQFGNKIYLDIEVVVADGLSLLDADAIVETLHNKLESTYKDIKHCSICPRPRAEIEKVQEIEKEKEK